MNAPKDKLFTRIVADTDYLFDIKVTSHSLQVCAICATQEKSYNFTSVNVIKNFETLAENIKFLINF